MNGILNEVQQNLLTLMEEKNASVIIESELPVLSVFKSGIAQLFQNLLTNAFKFCDSATQPVVTITATENDRYWLFKVSAEGDEVKGER